MKEELSRCCQACCVMVTYNHYWLNMYTIYVNWSSSDDELSDLVGRLRRADDSLHVVNCDVFSIDNARVVGIP